MKAGCGDLCENFLHGWNLKVVDRWLLQQLSKDKVEKLVVMDKQTKEVVDKVRNACLQRFKVL